MHNMSNDSERAITKLAEFKNNRFTEIFLSDERPFYTTGVEVGLGDLSRLSSLHGPLFWLIGTHPTQRLFAKIYTQASLYESQTRVRPSHMESITDISLYPPVANMHDLAKQTSQILPILEAHFAEVDPALQSLILILSLNALD